MIEPGVFVALGVASDIGRSSRHEQASMSSTVEKVPDAGLTQVFLAGCCLR